MNYCNRHRTWSFCHLRDINSYCSMHVVISPGDISRVYRAIPHLHDQANIKQMYLKYRACARDLLSRDRDKTRDPCLRYRDVQNFVWNKTKTRRCGFLDAGRDFEAPETLKSLESFNVLLRCFLWRMAKYIDSEKNYRN